MCSRTAPGTCTAWSSSSGRALSPTTTTRRRSPTGSGASGRATCSRPEIPPTPARTDDLDGRRPPLGAEPLEEEAADEDERTDDDERERPRNGVERAEVVEE